MAGRRRGASHPTPGASGSQGAMPQNRYRKRQARAHTYTHTQAPGTRRFREAQGLMQKRERARETETNAEGQVKKKKRSARNFHFPVACSNPPEQSKLRATPLPVFRITLGIE